MSDQTSNPEIHQLVRERYGKIASQGSHSSCCNPANSSCCSPDGSQSSESLLSVDRLYEAPDVLSLPDEVTGLSLGCGDPITLASLKPGETVLDLGSGGGIDCFLAARRVGSTGRVIGVDMTPAMLDRARTNQSRMGTENVEFRLGEIEHLPVADAEVDVIISNCVVNLSPDKPQVFREAFRALKPGGRLAVSDMVTGGPLPEAIKNSLSAWAGCVAGALEVQDYISAIRSAGFTEINLTPVYFDHAMVDEAVSQLGDDFDLDSIEKEQLYTSVFSAKITAVK